jgi:hypothetical protein
MRATNAALTEWPNTSHAEHAPFAAAHRQFTSFRTKEQLFSVLSSNVLSSYGPGARKEPGRTSDQFCCETAHANSSLSGAQKGSSNYGAAFASICTSGENAGASKDPRRYCCH